MIALTTSADLAGKEAALKTGLGQAIALLPGKSEAWLMLSLTGGTPMYFQGEARDTAFLDVSCFGQGSPAAYGKLTGALCDLLKKQLGLAPANVYVKYSETANWGWNGGNL
jgi:phenylpyruvate tautomerase PptA (4-oxalocrotonate tautomerase family)